MPRVLIVKKLNIAISPILCYCNFAVRYESAQAKRLKCS